VMLGLGEEQVNAEHPSSLGTERPRMAEEMFLYRLWNGSGQESRRGQTKIQVQLA
jgi:hypothetical protein